MTERRRFFPARRALAVPGTTSYVHAQLRPQETAMPTECPIDIAGPALLPEWRYMMGTVYEHYYWNWDDILDSSSGHYTFNLTGKKPEILYDCPVNGWEEGSYIDGLGRECYDTGIGSYDLFVKVNQNSVNHGSGYELPAAVYSADGRMTRCWVNLGEIKRPLRFRAVLLGRSMSNVRWTAELDTSMPWPSAWRKSLGELWPSGVDVEDEGHSMLIRVHPGTGPQNAGNWAAALTMTAHASGKNVGSLTLHMGWRTKPLAQQLQGDLYDFTGWDGWKPADDKETV